MIQLTKVVKMNGNTNGCESKIINEEASFSELLGTNLSFSPPQCPSAHITSLERYKELYEQSIADPEAFWGKIATDNFYWKKKWSGKFTESNFDLNKGPIFIEFMKGAKTNICYNALDRVAQSNPDKVAFYWEGNEKCNSSKITYGDLLVKVCKFANVLKSKGVKKGDRIAIYMPMVIELVVAMLASARIGAVHSIVFAGFSADALAERMKDGECTLLITADGTYRGQKLINLKSICDTAINECKQSGLEIVTCIVLKHVTNEDAPVDEMPSTETPEIKIGWNKDRDCWWHKLMATASGTCECEWMDAEDPLFILYTSGSTGKPKGVVHTTAGYMIYTATTFKYSFDYQQEDIYWCTADIGWITGHSYITYGPMLNSATSVIFEGVPTYPDVGRFWDIIDKYQVNQFYTAPTAIRLLMKFGIDNVKKYKRTSLRVIGTVGEPINPEAWLWYYKVVGDERCPVVDTFWQTETGGHMITALPFTMTMKPGSASLPFFGVVPAIVDEDGKELTEKEVDHGFLVFKQAWPGMMRSLYGDHQRFESVYFERFKGYYCSGDGCKRDADGFYWITGRVDDLMNVSGHLLSTAEIEGALIEHHSIAETAVVGYPHAIKGSGIYCFVVLKEGQSFDGALQSELTKKVRERIGPIANPDVIQHAPGLPKTRSGKIMRRVLRKIATGDKDVGDVTTLADPTVIKQLLDNHTQLSS